MIKKIIGAVSLFVVFIVTFAIGVGFIVRGAGDFSWDIVSQYVSMSDIVMINDTPISNLFSFSDHSKTVTSHAEGQIPTPTNEGASEIEDMPADLTMTVSEDEFIHFTFDGEVRMSCVVMSAANLTGKNVPNIEFVYNDGTDKATIRFKQLRVNSKETPKITIAIPASFGGTLSFDDVAGKVTGTLPLTLKKFTAKDVAGKLELSGINTPEADISDVAGNVQMDEGVLESLSVKDSAGKVVVNGSVGVFAIENIAGKVQIESKIKLAGDCTVKNVMGDISIKLPQGAKYKLKKSDVVGVVLAAGSKKADYTITVSDVMGKVSIDNLTK